MKPSESLIEATTTVFMAMAYRQTIEPLVKGYQKEILQKHMFLPTSDKRLVSEDEKDKPVLDPDRAYTLNENDFDIYLKELHEKHLENGFDVEFGYCPLLIAENMESDAKRELLEEAKHFTKLDPIDLLCSGMENYRKAVELTLRWVGPYVDEKKALSKLDKDIVKNRIKNKKSQKY